MFSLSFGEQSEIEKKKKGKGKVGAEVVEMVMKREKVRKREKKEGPTCRVYAPHFIIDFSYSVPTVSKQSFLLLRAVSVFICHFFLLERENFSARIAGIFTFFFLQCFFSPFHFHLLLLLLHKNKNFIIHTHWNFQFLRNFVIIFH